MKIERGDWIPAFAGMTEGEGKKKIPPPDGYSL